MNPSILFVPGLWEGPKVFEPLAELLRKEGFYSETASLKSTGTLSPGNPSMKDDIAGVRENLQGLVSRKGDVLLVLHSAGAFIASDAMEGWSKKERTEQGKKGGVVAMVFLTGGILPVGVQHPPIPFGVYEGGACHCLNPEVSLFSDFSEEERAKWMNELKPQPAEGWNDAVSYAGWQIVPTTYLICEGDQCLPVSLQEQCAATAKSRIERCSAGHLVQLSQPKRVIEVIKTTLASL